MRIFDASRGEVCYRIYLNGEDVSSKTSLAVVPDEPGIVKTGIVRMYKLNAEKKFYKVMDKYEVARAAEEEITGLVRWEPIERS